MTTIPTIALIDAVLQKLADSGYRLIIHPGGSDPLASQPRWAIAYEPAEDTEGPMLVAGLGFVMTEATIAYGASFPEAIRELAGQLGVL